MTAHRLQPAPHEQVTNVAIIGGGKGGKALMEIFAKDDLVRIVGLAETNSKAVGIPLAKKLGIPITKNYRTLLNSRHIDLVIDVTGNPNVEAALLTVNRSGMAMIGGPSAKYMWQLIDARTRAKAETERQLNKYQRLARLYVKEAASAVSEERTRIACDIHDGLIQTLVGLGYKLDLCQSLIEKNDSLSLQLVKQVRAQLKTSIEEARSVIFNLRPLLSGHREVIPALKTYLKSFETRSRVKTVFRPIGDERAIEAKIKIFVFRIIQEALSNIQKHAKADHVEVVLHIEKTRLVATISDDGIGFNTDIAMRNTFTWDSFGLRAIIERARIIGGDATIDSHQGRGTTITVTVPLARALSRTRTGKPGTMLSLPRVAASKRRTRHA